MGREQSGSTRAITTNSRKDSRRLLRHWENSAVLQFLTAGKRAGCERPSTIRVADDPEFTEGHAGLLRVRSLDAGWPGRKEVATGSQKDASPKVAEASRAVALRGHVEGRGLEMFAGALTLSG